MKIGDKVTIRIVKQTPDYVLNRNLDRIVIICIQGIVVKFYIVLLTERIAIHNDSKRVLDICHGYPVSNHSNNFIYYDYTNINLKHNLILDTIVINALVDNIFTIKSYINCFERVE